jgi:chaperone required for assembly of F1-ATPase
LALEYAASTLKSSSLAIALMNGRVNIPDSLDLSRLEENYQQTLYGIVNRLFVFLIMKAEGDHDLDEATALMMVAAAKNFYSLSH